MRLLELHNRTGKIVFNIDSDPIARIVPQMDGSIVQTCACAKEFVLEPVDVILAKIEALTDAHLPKPGQLIPVEKVRC